VAGANANPFVIAGEETFDHSSLSSPVEANFEANTFFGDMAVADTQGKMSVPHFTELARIPGAPMPYRGCRCLRFLSDNNSSASALNEDTAFDCLINDSKSYRFMVYVNDDLSLDDATADSFWLLELESTGPVSELVFGITGTSTGIKWGWGETSTATQSAGLATGKWTSIEIHIYCHATLGTIDVWIDGVAQTQISSLATAEVIQAKFGLQSMEADTYADIYMDQILWGAATISAATTNRLFAIGERHPETMAIHSSQQVCVGPGKLENVQLLSGAGTDAMLRIYDTDIANPSEGRLIAAIKATAANETVDPAGMPIRFNRGVYADLTDTAGIITSDEMALIKVGKAAGYGSDAAMRGYALRRKASASGF